MSEEQVEYQASSELVVASQETREFNFYGDTLLVALIEGVVYVALRPIVDGLKIDWCRLKH